MKAPVLLLVFNRPLMAMQVFNRIREYRPEQLFIAADGPRADRPGEAVSCAATRQQLLESIDWPCRLHTLFRDQNLGCGKAISGALQWFFETVESGMVLEDDCLPDPTFFTFCETLLERYRLHEKVMHINGSNFQLGQQRGTASYYYSRYAHVWGWAGWRRTWELYDFTLERYRNASREGLNRRLLDDLKAIYDQRIDTWDIQWFMSVWFNEGLTVTPNVSLVRNTGFGNGATHTKHVPQWFERMQHGSIQTLLYPPQITTDLTADRFTQTHVFDAGMKYTIKQLIKSNPLFSKRI